MMRFDIVQNNVNMLVCVMLNGADIKMIKNA